MCSLFKNHYANIIKIFPIRPMQIKILTPYPYVNNIEIVGQILCKRNIAAIDPMVIK